MMQLNNRLFLVAMIGVILSMGGLIWDVQIHILEHGSLAIEPLFNLSEPAATNPGHLVFGLGFFLTAASVVAGFTSTWIQMHAKSGRRWSVKALALPAAASLFLAVAGLATLFFLGQTG